MFGHRGARLSPEQEDHEDEFGVRLGDIQDALDSISDKAMEQVSRRLLTCTSNYLYAVNVPTTPADLLRFADLLARTVLATAVVDGTVKVTKSALAPEEEQAERKKQDEQASKRQDAAAMMLEAIQAARTGEPTATHPGGYL